MVTVQQYNKKRNIQTKITYDPSYNSFHDDNYGVTTALWETYYRYYYKDGQYGGKDTAGNHNFPQRAFNRGPIRRSKV